MKLRYTKYITVVCVLLLVLAVPMLAHADSPDNPPGDPDVPVDGGLSLLITAGVGYAIKRTRQAKKSAVQSSSTTNNHQL